MNKIFKFFPVALAFVALASCSNDDLAESQSLASHKTSEASIEGATSLTRTAFAENKDEDGKVTARALVWTTGDAFKVYGERRVPDKYTLASGQSGKSSATFDVPEDYDDGAEFAVFPYDKVEADRDNGQLTVTLGDWQYKTAEVQDEGYSEGAFVSDVPMYGVMNGFDATFYYMTGLLRVDLQKLPKKSSKLIIVTSRPMKGTFTADIDGADTQIISPVSNDAAKEEFMLTDASGNGIFNYTNTPLATPGTFDLDAQYFLTIGMEAVSQRTNKTFFIPVPTGNKYAIFDVWVEYSMGNATKQQLVAQLGNTKRLADNLSPLNWTRGKVKSLSREITVTSGGNTPKQISAFLASEWKTFPADADINVTVADANGVASAIDLSTATAGANVLTIPAELKNRVINIITPAGIEGFNPTGNPLVIKDDDPAPIASEALRLVNFVCNTANNVNVEINAPETQVVFTNATATSGVTTSTYGTILGEGGGTTGATVALGNMDEEAAGLTISKDVSFTDVTMLSGSFLSEGTITTSLTNDGSEETLVKGNTFAITSNKNGKITVKGKDDLSTAVGTITPKGAGDVYVEKIASVTIADGATNTGAITIDNVKEVAGITVNNTNHAKDITISNIKNAAGAGLNSLVYKGKGNVSINNSAAIVNTVTMSNANAGTLEIKGVTAGGLGSITYSGKKAVTIDDIKGNSGATINIDRDNDDHTGNLEVTNIKAGTIGTLNYEGIGNVKVTGVAVSDVYPTITAMTTGRSASGKAGNVELSDVTIGTSLAKNSIGTLTITGVRADFGTITNAKGNVTITGNNVNNVDITSLTQNGQGDITLTDISNQSDPAKVGTLGTLTYATNVNGTLTIENTFIDAFANGKSRSVVAKKASGIGSMTVNKATFTNDKWDGSFYAKKFSNNIYTTASFVALAELTGASSVNLYVDVDLDNKSFDAIKTNVTDLNGCKIGEPSTVSTPQVRTIKNLSLTAKNKDIRNITTIGFANKGLFQNRTTALSVDNITIDGVEISAPANNDANLGAIVGTTNSNISLNKVTVKNANINKSENIAGTSCGYGGMIGQVTGGTTTITSSLVENATIHGHYYMGGYIGQVTGATDISFGSYGVTNAGCKAKNFTFDVRSKDGDWNTTKSATVAPFIGGISGTITNDLVVWMCSYDEASLKKSDWQYSYNFLTSDETMKFIGTNRADTHFIGYTGGSISNNYYLKLESGFEADPAMLRWTSGPVSDLNYNAYAK